jgi:hypothetical protein
MAITNAQQYQQLVNKPANGKRPGYKGGADMGTVDAKDSKGNVTRAATNKGTPNVSAGGASFNDLGPGPSGDDYRRSARDFERGVEGGKADLKDFQDDLQYPSDTKNPLKKLINKSNLRNRKFFEDVIRAGKIPGLDFGTVSEMSQEELEEAYENYMNNRLSGVTDAYGNIINTSDGDDIIPLASNATLPGFDEPGDKDTIEEDISFRRFRADGGIMNSDVVGGEFDFESARQMYGLGKLVKKVTRGVKKIAKSPIGKAALLYAAGFGIPGTSFGGLLGTAKGSLFGAREGLFGTFGPTSALKKLGLMKSVGDAGMAAARTGPLSKLGIGSAISGISLVAGLLTPKEEAQAQKIADETGIDIEEIRNNPDKYLSRRNRAGGGLMRLGYQEGGDTEPVAKKTMPLLDMDGKEKDYRETGGFVDMGRMEKADDVPARLSKNEFVFTADAVRNAGEGDIDKGAEVMYNMMKNLEAGGEVSEESQGLEGARQMFQTSQRLEEVI